MKFSGILIVAFIVQQVTASISTISRASNNFAHKLYQHISEREGNVLVCPLCLHMVLSLLYQGAQGITALELRTHLSLSGTDQSIKESYQNLLENIQGDNLKLATKLYVSKDLKLNDRFARDARNFFYSGVDQLNFKDPVSAARNINQFVKYRTNNKIDNLISPDTLTEYTRLMIVNAAYFQASWKHKFEGVFKGVFQLNNKENKVTDMMYQENQFAYKVDPVLDAKVLRMDYHVGGYSMVFVLPKKVDGLAKVEATLAQNPLSLMTGLRQEAVEVTIPKFSLEYTIDLQNILKKMGMLAMFTERANLKGVTDQQGLFVSEIIQKTFINVHETGTEAGAASGVVVDEIRGKDFMEQFKADRPFLFKLVDTSNHLVLYEGRVSSP